MALGSSAPEILLSIISTAKDIEAIPPELGPSTIVGSAAFNLLVISAVSIVSVGGEDNEIKKIDDLWVFAVTTVFSLWAYIWMLICVEDSYISVAEGVLTCVFFVLLIVISFAADRITHYRESTRMSQEEQIERVRQEEIKIKKERLRSLGREYSDNAVIEIAQGLKPKDSTHMMSEEQKKEIRSLFCEIYEVTDLKDIPIESMLATMQPEKLLERFAYRKRTAGNTKEFVRIKGTKGQLDHDEEMRKHVKEENDLVGFKCLHYSVTESNGHVEVVIVKKLLNQELVVGVRTRDDTAVSPKDYQSIDFEVKFEKREQEKKIQIPIVDDEEWNPDLEFWVELYDPTKTEQGFDDRLPGDDTKCKVTILDEDFPGTIQFGQTEIRVSNGSTEVEIEVERVDGSDGTIACMISTEPLTIEPSSSSAQEFEDYLPLHQKVIFKHNETSQTIIIKLVNEKIAAGNPTKEFKDIDDDQGEDEDAASDDVDPDLIFKVKLDKPEPAGVKISKKNVCLVTIVHSEDEDKNAASQRKLLQYYLEMQDPTWGQLFKNAVLLGPVIDEEDHQLTEVDAWEAFCHFTMIGWKVLFALVPPPSLWSGGPCFFAALTMIGIVTYVVGEVATVLGCVLKIRESVTAISFVALGTSLPDTFASKTAAQQSDNADAAVGNITGSNAVNVFLGCGLPWIIGSIYWVQNDIENNGGKGYMVKSGPLAFSVIVFLSVATTCICVLIARRICVGGELGGTPIGKYLSGAFLVFLWFIYVLMSAL